LHRPSLHLEPEPLLESRLAGQADAVTGAYDSMPRDVRPGVAKSPYNLARRSGMAGCFGDLAVSHDRTTRNPSHYGKKILQLHFPPVISFSFEKNASFRSVSSPQLTGGD
jgi:hypothetical protein